MNLLPDIIRDTSEGAVRIPILDEMFRHREIECVGEITQDSVYTLILQLRYLQQADPNKEITMYINSPGGEITSGLALYDVMRAIKCPIRTVCVGQAASMAALLFVVGSQRDMLPHAQIMIHDPLIPGGVGGSALQLDNIAKDIMRVRQTTASIIAEHSGHSIEEVLKKTAADTYFSAEEAINWGLADTIISEL